MVASLQGAIVMLIETQAQRAALTAERARVQVAMGQIQYLGTDAETAVRWLKLLMVL